MSSCRLRLVRVFGLVFVVGLGVSMGCQTFETPSSASAGAAVVDPLNPPKGHVLRVWRGGDTLIDIGTGVGVEEGDWLSVMRAGEHVQFIEVTHARPNVSYCRVATRNNPTEPKVDDIVVLEPKNFSDIHRTD